jgi:hypothetical protein
MFGAFERVAFVGASLCAWLLARPGVALADDGAIAQELFRSGREAMERADFAVACAKFEESHRLQPAPGTLINLGECSEKLGRYAAAWRAYSEAADRLVGDERQAFVLDKVKEQVPKFGRLRVVVEPLVPGCTVKIDRVTLKAELAADPLPVDPGPARVELRCEDRDLASAETRIAQGTTVEVKLAPGPPTLKVVSPPSGEPSHAVAIAGWTLGGVGLVTLGVGGVFGGLAISRKGTVEELCTEDDPPRCPPDGIDAAGEGATFAAASTGLFVVGGVLAAIGVTLVVVDATTSSDAKTAVRIGPGWVGLDGTF